MPSASAACRTETQAYRKCLQDSRNSGGGSTKKCHSVAITLENCRERWRKSNGIPTVEFDGTRVLPNHKCRPLNAKVQRCLKWKQGDESQCRDEIEVLTTCMAKEKGVVVVPTEGDKVWSDYHKGRQEN
jgi:predicted methyltransferase